jgi:hypothetical protein
LPLLVFCTSCKHSSDEAPQESSSYEYRFDGSHLIPTIGVPTRFDTVSLSQYSAPTTAPVHLSFSDTNDIAVACTHDILIGNDHAMHVFARSTDSTDITELLADSASLYAVHLGGTVEKFSTEGKILWRASVGRMPSIGSILFSGHVVVSNDSELKAFNTTDGALQWGYRSSLIIRSVCASSKSHMLFAALTGNNADGTDSLICFKNDGSVLSRHGFTQTRITSNLSLCANDELAFGYLSSPDEKTRIRLGHVALWSNLTSSQAKREWDHALPYMVTSVCANTSLIVSGGFRETAGDLMSGIDAFRLDDTSAYWHRRFTYPVVMPLTVTSANVYIPFTFTTQALVPAKTVFVSLDVTDGSTIKELAVFGSGDGFVSADAMPVNGALAYSDRSAPRIYFLRP